MIFERPDLTDVSTDVVAYIESLESEIESLRHRSETRATRSRDDSEAEPSEPPTTMNVISISRAGIAKRTPRHLYYRQRRGGMGIFDLDSPEEDEPAFLLVADESAGVIAVTNHGRAVRLTVRDLQETPVRGRGQNILSPLQLRADERFSLAFADQGGAFLILVTERGQLRRIASQYLKSLQTGTVVFDVQKTGAPVACCWSSGNDDLFIATRVGKAIRFAERQVPISGCLGMRVDPDDRVVAIAAQQSEGGIFMLTADGKGTVRQLSGFTANKEPGSGGKVAMKTEELVGAMAVQDNSDIFAISQLGKLIRFQVIEVPAKEGVVQGVNCMALRSDVCVAVTGCVI